MTEHEILERIHTSKPCADCGERIHINTTGNLCEPCKWVAVRSARPRSDAMTFGTALLILNDGGRVTRPEWGKFWLAMADGTIRWHDGDTWRPEQGDVPATDWVTLGSPPPAEWARSWK
jgi:hypothetical protein